MFPPGQYALHSFDPTADRQPISGSPIVTDLRLVGTGAALISSSLCQLVRLLPRQHAADRIRRTRDSSHFERSSSQIIRRSVGAFYVTSTQQRESGDLRIAQVSVSDCYSLSDLHQHARGSDAGEGSACRELPLRKRLYGLSFQNNGTTFRPSALRPGTSSGRTFPMALTVTSSGITRLEEMRTPTA